MDTKLSTFKYHHILEYVGNSTEIPNLCETKKRENKMPKEKQSHAQDSIYVIRQFAYVHGVEEISLLSRKEYKV